MLDVYSVQKDNKSNEKKIEEVSAGKINETNKRNVNFEKINMTEKNKNEIKKELLPNDSIKNTSEKTIITPKIIDVTLNEINLESMTDKKDLESKQQDYPVPEIKLQEKIEKRDQTQSMIEPPIIKKKTEEKSKGKDPFPLINSPITHTKEEEKKEIKNDAPLINSIVYETKNEEKVEVKEAHTPIPPINKTKIEEKVEVKEAQLTNINPPNSNSKPDEKIESKNLSTSVTRAANKKTTEVKIEDTIKGSSSKINNRDHQLMPQSGIKDIDNQNLHPASLPASEMDDFTESYTGGFNQTKPPKNVIASFVYFEGVDNPIKILKDSPKLERDLIITSDFDIVPDNPSKPAFSKKSGIKNHSISIQSNTIKSIDKIDDDKSVGNSVTQVGGNTPHRRGISMKANPTNFIKNATFKEIASKKTLDIKDPRVTNNKPEPEKKPNQVLVGTEKVTLKNFYKQVLLEKIQSGKK